MTREREAFMTLKYRPVAVKFHHEGTKTRRNTKKKEFTQSALFFSLRFFVSLCLRGEILPFPVYPPGIPEAPGSWLLAPGFFYQAQP
jgi:hypothetical protein